MKIKSLFVVIACFSLMFCASRQTKLSRAREKDPQYHYNLGLFYLNGNNVDEAIKYLNKSLSLNPRFFLALNALGLAQSMKGNLQESAASFKKCLDINPQFTEAHNNLGTIYQEQMFIDKAEQEFKLALQDPNYSSRELPFYNLARLYFTMDRLDEALDNARKAIQVKFRFAMAHNLTGLILEKKGDLEGAIDAFKQATKIVPEEINFSYNLGDAYFKNEEFDKAGEILRKIQPLISDQDMRNKTKEYLDVIEEEEKEKIE